MRVIAAALLFSAASAPNLAHAQATYITPGYPMPYRGNGYGNGYGSPFPPMMQNGPGMTAYSGGTATGVYPPGARICVAQEQVCPARAPNTVGNPCTCTGRDGQPIAGMVR